MDMMVFSLTWTPWTVMAAGTAMTGAGADIVCMVGCTGGAIDVIEVMFGWIRVVEVERMGSGWARLARLTTATAPGGP